MHNGTQFISTTGESKRHLHLMHKEKKTNLRGEGGSPRKQGMPQFKLGHTFFYPKIITAWNSHTSLVKIQNSN